MASKRMTATPLKPARYRPGKVVAEDSSSDEEASDAEDAQQSAPAINPPPKATSFPSKPREVAANLSRVKIEATGDGHQPQKNEIETQRIAKAAEDEEFVTEESDKDSDESASSESGSEATESSAESSSEDEQPRKLLRPTFIKKNLRKETALVHEAEVQEAEYAEAETRRKEKADIMIQEQLDKDAIAREAGKKDWDDDEVEDIDLLDDTDGLDPEAERAAWKLRELKRVKREREAIENAEKEREEVERRRNLSKEDREAEDQEYLEAQKEAREGRGKMAFQQKYFHKGAFFQDDEVAETLANRDIMGSRIVDDVSNKELLPQFMQIRDMTKLGKKGRTKYKDLKSEDTGRWGQDMGRASQTDRLHPSFQSDRDRERSGANAAPLGERRNRESERYPASDSRSRPVEDGIELVDDRKRSGEGHEDSHVADKRRRLDSAG